MPRSPATNEAGISPALTLERSGITVVFEATTNTFQALCRDCTAETVKLRSGAVCANHIVDATTSRHARDIAGGSAYDLDNLS